jgi:hypothetical protein
MLPYLVLLHEKIPAVKDRWDYHLRTLEAGKLLDEPIPLIRFGPANEQVFKLLVDWSRLIAYDCGGWNDFRTLMDWLCWGLTFTAVAPNLTDEVNTRLYRQVNMEPLLEAPHDYLGDYVARNRARGWNPTGFNPTPHPVVECMVQIQMHDMREEGKDTRTCSVCDPCVGSGRMLLHASNYSLSLCGQDIDPLCIAMCKINGALYTPWLAFPLPESILNNPSR